MTCSVKRVSSNGERSSRDKGHRRQARSRDEKGERVGRAARDKRQAPSHNKRGSLSNSRNRRGRSGHASSDASWFVGGANIPPLTRVGLGGHRMALPIQTERAMSTTPGRPGENVDQHTIARFYLNGFSATPVKQVYVRERGGTAGGPKSTKTLTVEENAFAIFNDGKRDNSVSVLRTTRCPRPGAVRSLWPPSRPTSDHPTLGV